ncbi:MAG: hypothetical protein U1E73_13110 [Planctomycetota bacterium]
MRPTLPLVLLFAAPLAAQTTAAPPPTPPHVVIDTHGPDGWRQRLGPTNLGTMLESEKGKKLWQPYAETLFAVWREAAGGDEPFAAARARALAYGGRIRIGIWLPPAVQLIGPGEATAIAAVLEPDGRSDLAAIGDDLTATIEHSLPGEWTAVKGDDGVERRARSGDGKLVTAPFLIDGKLVIAAAEEEQIAAALGHARALAGTKSEPVSPLSPALQIRFDFPAIVAAGLGAAGNDQRDFMSAIGLPGLGAGTFSVSTAGPRVLVEYAQGFSGDDRGIFAALMPDTPTVPTLLAARPEKGFWTVGHFDLQKLYNSILTAVCKMENEDLDATRAKIVEECGIDPDVDLLAHATDDVMVWAPETEGAEESPLRTNWVLTFRLRDEVAFRKGLFALLPKARPFMQRERSEKHDDVEIFRYGNMLSYDLWLAAGHGVFVVSGGHDAQEHLEEMLDHCAKLPATLAADLVVPADFAPLKRYLPPGCHGYSLGDASQVASMPALVWDDLFGLWRFAPLGSKPPEDPEEAETRRKETVELLREHRLDVARSATGYADRTWRYRFYW